MWSRKYSYGFLLELIKFNEITTIPYINTYNDHRMAMAFAPLALKHTIEFENPNVVEKSYPKFWKDMEVLGGLIMRN